MTVSAGARLSIPKRFALNGVSGLGGVSFDPNSMTILSNEIRRLFSAGEKGVWYDPSDLYQAEVSWRRNLLLNSSFGGAIGGTPGTIPTNWPFQSSGGSIVSVVAGIGNSNVLTLSATAARHYFGQSVSVSANTTYISSIYVVANSGLVLNQLLWHASLPAGTVVTALANGAVVSDSVYVPVAGDRISLQYAVAGTAGTPVVRLGIGTSGNATGTVSLSRIQFELSSVATDYQRITDFNSDFLAAFPYHTIFQDSAGTIPVTATGQPVGLILDKSKGALNGPELLTNGDFSSASGWVVSATPPATASISGGVFTFNSPSGEAAFAQQIVLTLLKWYKVVATVTAVTGAGVKFQAGSGASGIGVYTVTAPGTYTFYVAANGSDGAFLVSRVGAGSATVDSVSVREIQGNHAYQTTSTSRPILRQTPNLDSEKVVNGAFAVDATGWTAVNSPVLSVGANGVSITNNGASSGLIYQALSTVVGRTYRISVKITYGGVGFARVETSNAVPTGVGGGLINANVSGTYDRDFIATATTTHIVAGNRNDSGATHTYDDISFKEITSYRADRNYLEFDGVDDWLSTQAIDFTTTDKMTVVAGLRKLSDAAGAIVFETSVNLDTNAGTFNYIAPSATGLPTYLLRSKGTAVASATPSGFAAPVTNIVSMQASISGDSLIARVNGVQAATSSADQGTGNYGNYPLYIGRRGGASLPFNGRLYGLIVRAAASTDLQITNAETFMNSKTGAF